MHEVCLINGSLHGKKSSSLQFLSDLDRRLPGSEFKKSIFTVKFKGNYSPETLRTLAETDSIVLVFPLYNYGLPGALMRLLEEYYRFSSTHAQKAVQVYAIINCAFPRPEVTTGEAVRVIRNFCRRLSMDWRFAICIGTGPVVAMTRRVPFLDRKLKKAYVEIASDIKHSGTVNRDNYYIRPVIPETVIASIKRWYEKKGHMIDHSSANNGPSN